MLAGPQCFNEFLAAVPGLSDRLLTERVNRLSSMISRLGLEEVSDCIPIRHCLLRHH